MERRTSPIGGKGDAGTAAICGGPGPRIACSCTHRREVVEEGNWLFLCTYILFLRALRIACMYVFIDSTRGKAWRREGLGFGRTIYRGQWAKSRVLGIFHRTVSRLRLSLYMKIASRRLCFFLLFLGCVCCVVWMCVSERTERKKYLLVFFCLVYARLSGLGVWFVPIGRRLLDVWSNDITKGMNIWCVRYSTIIFEFKLGILDEACEKASSTCRRDTRKYHAASSKDQTSARVGKKRKRR